MSRSTVIATARGCATTDGAAGSVCVTSMISGARNACLRSAMRAAPVLLSLPIVRTSSETPPASQSPLLYTCLFSGRLPDMVLSGTLRRLLHRQCVVQVWSLRVGYLCGSCYLVFCVSFSPCERRKLRTERYPWMFERDTRRWLFS